LVTKETIYNKAFGGPVRLAEKKKQLILMLMLICYERKTLLFR